MSEFGSWNAEGGMEFTWRYAWTFFLTLLLLNRPLPLPETMALFILASVVTILSRHRYRRVYQALALHFFGFSIAWTLTIHRFYYQHLPLFDSSWVVQEFLQLQKPQQWFIHLLLLACLLLFWIGARAMMKRAPTYFSTCLQFDRGLGALFLLLLIKFMVQLKGGILLKVPVTRIQTAQHRMRNPRHWPSRIRGWLGPQHIEFNLLIKTEDQSWSRHL